MTLCTRCELRPRYKERTICLGCINLELMAKRKRTGKGRPQTILTGERLAQAIAMYSDGKTLSEVGSYFNAGRTAVARLLRKAGVTIRNRGHGNTGFKKEKSELPGFNAFSNDWAKRPLRVGA